MMRFVRYKEEDLLTATDIIKNSAMLMVDATGAFIHKARAKWIDSLLDVSY